MRCMLWCSRDQDAETFLFALFSATSSSSPMTSDQYQRYVRVHRHRIRSHVHSEYDRLYTLYTATTVPKAVPELRAWEHKHKPKQTLTVTLATPSTIDADMRAKIASLLLEFSVCHTQHSE